MTATIDAPAATPGLARRLAAFLYEGVLLFGVVFFVGLIYAGVTQQRHALHGRTGLGLLLFVVIGAYFIAFWTRSGQTLAMKTWHLRVVDNAGRPLSAARALGRFLLSWLWFVPALLATRIAGLHSGTAISGALIAGMLAYALLARLHPQRRFLHDLLSGTQIVTQLPTRP
ncbi:MAG: hypothetical protein DI603_04965 [Roseateles depolymerans]|uniref:RDD domain-containing protein n=1 Tax=Roseateles depolymerans TaxID=76731 RepID=A0A2W5E157_9BURK|nr:MAG: hypothetical protein DI603_04965 [Roseateles depolymerans]